MDYTQWGAEYLREADMLKERVDMLRGKFTGLGG